MGDPFLHLLICSFIGQVSFLSQTPFLIEEVLQLLPQIAITLSNCNYSRKQWSQPPSPILRSALSCTIFCTSLLSNSWDIY